MRLILVLLFLLLLGPGYAGDKRLDLLPRQAWIATQRVPLDSHDPARTRLGALTYLGGVRLTGPGRAFGGFSAMDVNGQRFTLLSDGGNIVSFTLDSQWRLSAPRFAELPAGPGRGWGKFERDSESLTRDPVTGQMWVGFEWANQIWRYSPGLVRAEAHTAPPEMARWEENAGPESMVRLRDGSFIVLAESVRGERADTQQALWFAGDPTARRQKTFRFSYRPPGGFRPVDMAELPDGRIAVLNRRVSLREGFTAALTIMDRKAIRAGAIVTGHEVARFAAPVIRDNFEALAVTEEAGATILWIASDDNQLFLQRSLLLKFRLDE